MSNWWDADPVASGQPAARITVNAQPRYADAIAGIESGGNYRAVGPQTGKGRALGKYQVMDFNVGPWTEQATGRRMTPLQFLGSPEAQDKVFQTIFGGYVDKYGPEGAAKAWFAGEGGMNNPDARDVLGTSVTAYADKFNRAIAQPAPQTAAGNWWDADPVAEPGPVVERFAEPEAKLLFERFIEPQAPAQQRPDSSADQPDIGAGTAFLEGVRSGVTANFGDELAGVAAAAGRPEELQNPFSGASDFMTGLARLGYEYLTGGDEAAKRYANKRDEVRATQKAAQEQYPGTNIAGQVAGAVALPVGGALNAATLPARMGRGAAVGTGYGAAAGAGEGENLTDRASRATSGGLIGGAVGAAAPPVVEGIIQGARALARPAATAVRGAVNPESEAARRVAEAIGRDIQIDPQAVSRLTPQEFSASRQIQGPARLVDIGGETTRGLARSAANTSPEGRQVLNQAINDRFEGQTGRITGWLRETFNYPNAGAQREALEQAATAVNRPAYRQAYADGNRVRLWDQELQQLVQAPEVQAAIRIALPNLRNWAVRDGMAPPVGAFEIANGRTVLRQTQNGNTVLPSLQYWDYVKRALDQMGTPTSGAFARALREHLDTLVPSYREARAGAAHFFGAENALEAGQNFVMQNFAAGDVRRQLARMSQQERQLFQDGFVSRFIETLERVGDRRSVLNQVAASPAAREKLTMALGPQRAAELEAGLRVEGIMDLARGAVQGNSTTARQLAEIGFAGGAGSLGAYGTYNMDPTQMTYAAVAGALLAGKRGIDQRVAQRVAQMLVSNDPRQLVRGIQMVARNGRMMDALRLTDAKLTQIAAQEAPKPALIQAPAAVRAEDDQPEIPRPPSQ